ncbi:MAG: hypothetical protein Q8N47_27480 [Bryobacterales bacterium]|nr:hypothetical protein [Bryobacterales bacterium]
MSERQILGSYLADVGQRLRLRAWTRGLGVVGVVALAATLILTLGASAAAFSPLSVLVSRVTLFLALVAAVTAGMVLPLRRLNRREVARRAEREFPAFEQRLLTFAEKDSSEDPFLELLAADATEVARSTEPRRLAPGPMLAGFASLGIICIGGLIWLVTSAPGFLGHGAALLWGATGRTGAEPFYEIVVQPGDATVRKGGNQTITAAVRGIEAMEAKVHARFNSASKWEETAMLPREGGAGFDFLFAGLSESAEYFVTAGRLTSKRFKLSVIELPSVKRIRVTYHYPGWLGIRNAVEQEGGDLRAVEGTEAEVAIQTDRPLTNGVLVLDGAKQLKLEAGAGNWVRAKVPIQKDGLYHIAALDRGAPVRLSEDYFIEAQTEKPPTLVVRRPGRDAKVSPIEEVVVEVEAEDDFALEGLDLHYSVNGGPEKAVSLLGSRGRKQAQGGTMISLENYQLVPGDIVALYATARDARTTSKTDIYFLEAQPWEREITQSQTMGGGGQGGDGEQQGRISQRQKEIIAATWNQSREAGKNRAAAAENAKFLTDVQSKLRDQAQTLARRMGSRELSGVNQEFNSFSKDMNEAAADMDAAAGKLKAQNWREALPAEQRALQHILRAEATFRQIQVAFGSRGGGGSGGGGSGRDLENMFDLELDLEKNQYEAGQQRASADQRQREVDEAMQRLEQLARRQQELAGQQARQRPQNIQQRWQQEMLRREAEELQRQMEQMARGQQQGSSGQSSPTQQRLNRMSGQQGSASSGDQRIEQALRRLQQAQDDMRKAAGSEQNPADSRRAAERLDEARDLMSGMRRQQASGQLDDLARRAEQLASMQREHSERLRRMFSNPNSESQPVKPQVNSPEVNRIAGEKEGMLGDLQRLESDMQGAARDLAGAQRAASSKLREALGQLQQEEIALRMRYNNEYLRKGYGAFTWMREAPVTAGLEKLRDRLQQARGAVDAEPSGQGELERSLAQVERLRNRLEQLTRGRAEGRQQSSQAKGGSDSQANGGRDSQAKGGSDSQGNGGRNSRANGGQRGFSQSGQQRGGERTGDDFSAMNRGDLRWDGGIPDNSAAGLGRAYREGLRELQSLGRDLRDDPQAGREIQQAIREIERLDAARFPGNPELVARLRDQVLPSIEQLELLLRRKLEERQSGQVRSATGERIPQGYGAAVAEYYRRLSRSK